MAALSDLLPPVAKMQHFTVWFTETHPTTQINNWCQLSASDVYAMLIDVMLAKEVLKQCKVLPVPVLRQCKVLLTEAVKWLSSSSEEVLTEALVPYQAERLIWRGPQPITREILLKTKMISFLGSFVL